MEISASEQKEPRSAFLQNKSSAMLTAEAAANIRGKIKAHQ